MLNHRPASAGWHSQENQLWRALGTTYTLGRSGFRAETIIFD